MTSTKGRRIWKPAPMVPLYLPSRSTTYAFCCGTTTAVLARMMMNRKANPRMTTKPNVIAISLPSLGRVSFGSHPERQPLNALDQAALPRGESDRALIVGGPDGAPHLHLADPAGRDAVDRNRGHPDEGVDVARVALDVELAEQRLAQEEDQPGGEADEQEPFQPGRAARAEHGDQADDDRRDSQEHQIEASQGQLQSQQDEAGQNPGPPRHILSPPRSTSTTYHSRPAPSAIIAAWRNRRCRSWSV